MKLYLCCCLLLMCASLTFAEECFAIEKMFEDAKDIIEGDCGMKMSDLGSMRKAMKAMKCMLKKQGCINENDMLLTKEFYKQKEKYIIKKKEEIKQVYDDCCQDKDERNWKDFIMCFQPEAEEVCRD